MQDEGVFLRETPTSLATVLTPQLSASAGAVLQVDDGVVSDSFTP